MTFDLSSFSPAFLQQLHIGLLASALPSSLCFCVANRSFRITNQTMILLCSDATKVFQIFPSESPASPCRCLLGCGMSALSRCGLLLFLASPRPLRPHGPPRCSSLAPFSVRAFALTVPFSAGNALPPEIGVSALAFFTALSLPLFSEERPHLRSAPKTALLPLVSLMAGVFLYST